MKVKITQIVFITALIASLASVTGCNTPTAANPPSTGPVVTEVTLANLSGTWVCEYSKIESTSDSSYMARAAPAGTKQGKTTLTVMDSGAFTMMNHVSYLENGTIVDQNYEADKGTISIKDNRITLTISHSKGDLTAQNAVNFQFADADMTASTGAKYYTVAIIDGKAYVNAKYRTHDDANTGISGVWTEYVSGGTNVRKVVTTITATTLRRTRYRCLADTWTVDPASSAYSSDYTITDDGTTVTGTPTDMENAPLSFSYRVIGDLMVDPSDVESIFTK